MKRSPRPTRTQRRVLLLGLIAGTLMSGSSVMTADAGDEILVTAAVEDCCPPISVIDPCCPPCGPAIAPAMPTETVIIPEGETESIPAPTTDATTDGQAAPAPQFDAPVTEPTQNVAQAADNFSAAPAATSLASTAGGGGGLDAPNMLGDTPGYGPRLTDLGLLPDYSLPGAAARRFKITENVSPIPQDRVFFTYNHFDDALQQSDTVNTWLDRYIIGGEKTFADGLFSVELRTVITDGFDSEQDANPGFERGGEFGDLQFALKALLYSSCTCQVGGGFTVTAPTADDIVIAGTAEIATDTVYLAPFIGFVSTPSKNSFWQGFMQADFALGGDDVYNGAGVFQGTFNDQHLFYASLSAGHWLYRDDCRSAKLNGLAAMLELHYTTAFNDADAVGGIGAYTLTAADELHILNLTSGLVAQKGLTSLRIGGSVPLREDQKLYDSEFQLQLNRRF